MYFLSVLDSFFFHSLTINSKKYNLNLIIKAKIHKAVPICTVVGMGEENAM